ncbi:MAG: hypothetical protein FJ291_24790 [Planctomycetes bacterium]|nr:hypothetical protein [Planctomycetota bacterium]
MRRRVNFYGAPHALILTLLLAGLLLYFRSPGDPWSLVCCLVAAIVVSLYGLISVFREALRGVRDAPERAATTATALPSLPNVPGISVAEYLALSQEEKDRVQLEAYEANRPWIERKLNELGAEWLLVANGEVVKASPTLDDYPFETPMDELARQYGGVPVIFVRSPLIEESARTVLPKGDSYPTLPIEVADREVVADFDTGSPCTMLDHEWLEARSVLGRGVGVAHEGKHLGTTYSYRLLPVPLTLRGEDGRAATLAVRVRAVFDWRNSPLCSPSINPNRAALAGRDLLRGFGATVELDGRACVTRVRLQ